MKCLSRPPTLIRIWELSLPSVLSASVNKIECIAIAFCKHTSRGRRRGWSGNGNRGSGGEGEKVGCESYFNTELFFFFCVDGITVLGKLYSVSFQQWHFLVCSLCSVQDINAMKMCVASAMRKRQHKYRTLRAETIKMETTA